MFDAHYPELARTLTIRLLNDAFRRPLIGGRTVMTQAVAAMDPEPRQALICAVQNYQAFSPENDPDGEHNFGDISLNDELFYFKIDYYDLAMEAGSPDPTDPRVTTRVLTIMHARDY